jgi:hypothetical protein
MLAILAWIVVNGAVCVVKGPGDGVNSAFANSNPFGTQAFMLDAFFLAGEKMAGGT